MNYIEQEMILMNKKQFKKGLIKRKLNEKKEDIDKLKYNIKILIK